jgi:Ion channel
VASAMLRALTAHLVEMTICATVFAFCGEFAQLSPAFYHSAINYTTLGYADVVMSASWKLSGSLETADGMLMFGVPIGMSFAVIQRLVETRFHDPST